MPADCPSRDHTHLGTAIWYRLDGAGWLEDSVGLGDGEGSVGALVNLHSDLHPGACCGLALPPANLPGVLHVTEGNLLQGGLLDSSLHVGYLWRGLAGLPHTLARRGGGTAPPGGGQCLLQLS